MSREAVEVVRRFNSPYDGQDMIPAIRDGLGRLGPDPQAEEVLALWAEDPMLQHLHPDIEWDIRAVGIKIARGPRELARMWGEWVETWESYTYRLLDYRDLGDWVLSTEEIHATGREGISVEAKVFQIWRIRDGKVAVTRVLFLSRRPSMPYG